MSLCLSHRDYESDRKAEKERERERKKLGDIFLICVLHINKWKPPSLPAALGLSESRCFTRTLTIYSPLVSQ